MQLRFLLPLVSWVAILFLLLFRTYATPEWNWYGITSYRLIHFALFLGFSHISLVTLKKQLRFEKLRGNAKKYVLGVGLAFAILLPLLRFIFSFSGTYDLPYALFNVLGILAGMLTFYFMYKNSC